MFRFFPLVLVLQGFCIYHAYKNNTLQKWFFVIFFLPLIGSLIYLYAHFYSRKNIENLSEGVKSVLNTNYKIEKLEKELRVAETTTNKIRLADEYVNVRRVEEAIKLYESSMNGISADDPDLLLKMMKASFLNKDYQKVVECGDKMKSDYTFKNAEERVAYAWSLYHLGQKEAAETIFKDMDARFSNYMHRMEYSKFLETTERPAQAKDLLAELIDEYNHLDNYEQRLKKPIIQEVRRLYQRK